MPHKYTLKKKKHSSSLFFHAISMFKFTPQNFTSWLCTCECTAVPNYYKSDQHQRENILNSRFHRFTRQSAARNWTVERNTCCWLKSTETAKPLWWASRFFIYFFTYITWCSALYKNFKKNLMSKKKDITLVTGGQVWNARLDPSKVFVNRSDIFFSNGHLLPIKFQGHLWDSSHAAAVV